MKKQQHMVMTALITILLAVFGSVQNAVGEVTRTYDSSTKTLTLKFDASGDIAAYSSKLTDVDKAASIVIFDGPELNDNDVNKINVFTNSVIDLRKVKTISTNTANNAWGFNSWNLNSSVVFPNNTAISTLKSLSGVSGTLTFVSAEGNKLNVATNHVVNMVKIGDFSNAFNYVKGSDGSINTIDLASSGLWEQSKSEGFFAPLDFVGVKNLVLENLSNCNTSQDSFKRLKNIRRVFLPENTDLTSYAYSSESSVEVYQTLKKISDTETVCQLNIVKAGGLAALKDAPYTSENIKKAYCFDIYGTANKDDYGAMNSIDNPRLNLSQMTFDANDFKNASDKLTALDQIKNPHIKYLALPDAGDEVSDPLFNTLRTNMKDNLIGVAYYCKNKKSYTCYTSKEGDVHILTEMTENVTKVDGQGNPNLDIDSLKISGNVNAKDISCNTNSTGDYAVYYDENGHFAFTNEYHETEPNGYREMNKTAKGNYNGVAFAGSNGVKKLDLKDANFKVNDDLTLSKTLLVRANTQKVVIPTSVENLPADFMHVNNSVLEEICIPRNIKRIGAHAFYGITNLNHVTTTDENKNVVDYGFGLKTETKDVTVNGKTYKEQIVTDSTKYDPSSGTIVFSDQLEEIDSWAFASIYRVKDVYNRATTAPICHVNAFGSEPYCGNNGFQPCGGITRDDYRKSDGVNESRWIIMLHYPTVVHGTDNEKRYTDVTRDYTITDAEGHTDKWGNVLHWPNQSEFSRAYEQATNGYLWNAWSTERETWSNLGSYSLKVGDNGYQMTQEEANKLYLKNGNTTFYHTKVGEDGDTDNGAFANVMMSDGKTPLYGDKDYRGWHQFVLATPSDGDDTPSHNFSYINDNNWWTICVPFDMTKEEVKEMFACQKNDAHGKPTYGKPHVCEFTGVLRDAYYDENPNKEYIGKIVLKFDRDVYNNVYDEKGSKIGVRQDNDVVIHAGVPYLLQPDFEVESDGSYYYPAQQVLKSNKCGAQTSSQLMELAKKNVVEVTAVDANNTPLEDYKYTFVGSFWQTEMPGFAYFLAWYQPAGDSKGFATFYWQAEQPKGTLNWNPYTAIIGCNWSDRVFYIPTDGKPGNVHWFTRQGNAENGPSVFKDDSFTNTGSAKANGPENVSIEAAGNTTDGITKVHFGDRTIEIFHGKVYNLNGQYVGDSLEGLPKGIYIAAGKKYVVK